MTLVISDAWSKNNQQYLSECIQQVKDLLENKTENCNNQTLFLKKPSWNDESFMPAIEHVCQIFDLSSFERSILLMCAATELDSEVSQLFAKVQKNPDAVYPTFSLCLAFLADAHWSALAPTGPLRKFRLIDILGQPNVPMTKCQLHIDERILHFLLGIQYLDKSLRGIIEPVEGDVPIVDSQRMMAEEILYLFTNARKMFHVQLVGPDDASKKAVASWVCRQQGANLCQLSSDLIPTKPEDVESLAVLWTRESFILNARLYVVATEMEQNTQKSVRRFLASLSMPAFVSTVEHWPSSESFEISFDVHKPTKQEQKRLWSTLLVGHATDNAIKLETEISKLVNQFDLSVTSIYSATAQALLAIDNGENLESALWSSSLKTARLRLSELATRITPHAKMDDLILPEREKQLLESIIANVRQRYKVYEEWGFSKAGDRGLGITALFSGDSGTGKTMAAEVMAAELDLDLFKIDLSMVINKYIGETEKNLRKIFDAAEDGGAILFFDEADALFGKRSEVRDSHDRYANIEVGYLLQRMESYRGLAILTTNMKDSLDKAFLRRMRFVVNFPLPDEKSREEIWRRVFPKSMPVGEIDYLRLARLDIAGGHIRNIALGAAFLAAEGDAPVNMEHLRQAAKEEYGKMNRTMSGGEWNY